MVAMLVATPLLLAAFSTRGTLSNVLLMAGGTALNLPIPVSVVYRKDRKAPGPLHLYGYGAYGIAIEPGFSTSRLSLVDRGMIYAIAHIRGGGELGEPWRQEGRMFKKLNTFNDFVDSARWLTANKYTSPDRLVIQGGSAGGLLMGAVVNQAPRPANETRSQP